MAKKKVVEDMKKELSESLSSLEKEKNISKDTMIVAIETALLNAYKNNYGEDNCKVVINKDTYEASVYAVKDVVETVANNVTEISLEDARLIDGMKEIGDKVYIKIDPKSFGRISINNAKNLISQKFREEEKKVLFSEFESQKGKCVYGKVSRIMGKNIAINLGKADALLKENEQVKGEHFKIGDRIKVYIVNVTMTNKGPQILASRTHKELVRGLFEDQVTEMAEGLVEIKSISREPGNRSKIAVCSNDEMVDPVGSCVGMNGDRVDAVVDELFGEKIDIVEYDENPAYFIENALSPAKVIFVAADPEEKEASVVVPDYQLSLAIGKEGQNARLAARLTGYKIDIKSESQAREAGELPENYEGYSEDDMEENVQYDDDYYYESDDLDNNGYEVNADEDEEVIDE